MATKHDNIPRKDAEFDSWLKNMMVYVQVKTQGTTPEWTHIPSENLTALEDAYSSYHVAFMNCQRPHTKAETTIKNEEKKKATGVSREFVQRFLMFGPVTDADRDNMKIHNRDKTVTPIGRPPKAPVIRTRPAGERFIEVDFWEEGSASKARPYGYSGAVMFYAVLDTPPQSQDELTKSELATKTPFPIECKETDRGKKLYIAASWQNQKGQLGPVSGIITAVIP